MPSTPSTPRSPTEEDEEIFAMRPSSLPLPPPPPPPPPPPRRTSTHTSNRSFDSAGEARMGEDMLRMIQTDEDAEEAREMEGQEEGEEQSRSDGASGGGGGGGSGSERDDEDEEEDEGAGKEELQSLIVRLMLHSAEQGTAFEADLEQDLRSLVGSHLFDEMFETSTSHSSSAAAVGGGGGGGSSGHSSLPPPPVPSLPTLVSSSSLGSAANRRRAGLRQRSGSSIGGGSDDMSPKLVAALAGLQVQEHDELPPSLSHSTTQTQRKGSMASSITSGKESVEDKEEDDIRLQPAAFPRAAGGGLGAAAAGASRNAHTHTHTHTHTSTTTGTEGEEGEDDEDEWINDADPGYQVLHITEEEFFDLEEAALEAAQRALTAKRLIHQHDFQPPHLWQRSGGSGKKEKDRGTHTHTQNQVLFLEDDLAEAEALLKLKEQEPPLGPSSLLPSPVPDLVETATGGGGGGEGGGEGGVNVSVVSGSSAGAAVWPKNADDFAFSQLGGENGDEEGEEEGEEGGGDIDQEEEDEEEEYEHPPPYVFEGRERPHQVEGTHTASTTSTSTTTTSTTDKGSRYGIGDAVRAQARRGRLSAEREGDGAGGGNNKDKDKEHLDDDGTDDDDEASHAHTHTHTHTGGGGSKSSHHNNKKSLDNPLAAAPRDEEDEDADAAAAALEAELEAGEEVLLLQHELEGPPLLSSFNLKVIYEPHKTGFEENKDFIPAVGELVAGRYRVQDYLGTAVFSTAVECIDIEATARARKEQGVIEGEQMEPVYVCLKIIKNNKDFFDQSLDEIKLLQLLQEAGDPDEHHFLRMCDFFYYREHLIIVSELLKDNLYEFGRYLRETGQPSYFTLPRLRRIAKQCLEALAFVHAQGLIHCDVKPENIVVQSFSRVQVKLIDFGSSCFVTDPPTSYLQSRSYRAPEVILGTPYSNKIDVWSLGCVLAELFSGYVLFQNESVQGMLARMMSVLGPFPDDMLLFGKETTKYFTSNYIVYEREGARGGEEGEEDGLEEEEELEEEGEGEEGEDGKGGGSVSLLYPKKTTLAARIRTEDGLFLDFLSKLLTLHPEKRPTAEEALRDPWLSVVDEEGEEGEAEGEGGEGR